MAGRSKKSQRSTKHTEHVDEGTLVKRGASVKAIKSWADVEHDSEEEFDTSKDKVLLSYDKRIARGANRKNASDDDDDDEDAEQEVFGVSDAGSSSDEDSGNNNEPEEGAWGKKGYNYYDADDFGTDSEDDEAAFAEEAEEALRLQRKQMEALDEDDFIEDLGMQMGVDATGGLARLVSTADDAQGSLDMSGQEDLSETKRQALLALPEADKLKVLQAESPELLTLVQDLRGNWGTVQELRRQLERAADLGASVDDHPALAFLTAKHQLLMSYINNVAVYLVLKASTSKQRGGILLRDHPVIGALVEFRRRMQMMDHLQERLEPLLAMFAEDLASGKLDTGNADSDVDMEDAQAQVETETKAVPSTQDKATSRTKSATKSKKTSASSSKDSSKPFLSLGGSATATPAESYAALRAMLARDKPRKPTPAAATTSWDAIEDGDFGEHEHLDENDVADKNRALRRLHNHAKRIAQGHAKREAKHTYSGDADVPYKNRTAAALRLDDKSAAATRKQAEQYGDDLDDGLGDDLGMDLDSGAEDFAGEDGEDYYAEVERAKEQRVEAKEQRKQESWKLMVQANQAEEAAVEGETKRSVNYQILKNKGLKPRRTKEQRNPRVKRRKRFEQAKKKLGSTVTQVRQLEGNYGGEATGIKSSLSRSTRFK
ncbi:something about silencing protein 10 [Coemansia sp. Benny D115]|nr:something about silencing protein 10 [Coemansia sp. Benny D115]